MKKIIYISTILITSLASGSVYAQAYDRCYSSGDNGRGGVEKIFVKLSVNAGKAEIIYRKYSVGEAGTSYINISKRGVIEGNKIILAKTEVKKENNAAEPEINSIWFFQDDSLVVGEDVLQPADCN